MFTPSVLFAQTDVIEQNVQSETDGSADRKTGGDDDLSEEKSFTGFELRASDSEMLEIYRPVLEDAKCIVENYVENKFNQFDLNELTYGQDLNGVYFSCMDMGVKTLDQFGYIIQDFSGDGVPELAIVLDYPGSAEMTDQFVSALFTSDSNGPVYTGVFSMGRDNTRYGGNGYFIKSGSGSAWDSSVGRFSLSPDGQSILWYEDYFTQRESSSDQVFTYSHFMNGTGDLSAAQRLGGPEVFQEHYEQIMQQKQFLNTTPLSEIPQRNDEYQLSAKIEGDGKTVSINHPFRIRVSLNKNGSPVEHWTDYSFICENPSQASLDSAYDVVDFMVFVVNPKQAGPMKLVIGDTVSGAKIDIELEVKEKRVQYAYPIPALEEAYYPDVIGDRSTLTNFYNLNGLYINNYRNNEITVDGKKSCHVTFDIFNLKYSYGSVDVYDKDGNLIGIHDVSPHRNITGLIELPDRICKLVSDAYNSKLLSYTSETVSAKTSIDIEVPEGGYFTVSNNVFNSPGAMVFNSIDAMIFGTSKVISHITADKTKTRTTIFDLFKMTDIQFMQKYPSEAASLAIKKNILNEVQKSHETIAKGCAKRFMKESAKAGSKISFGLAVDMGEALIKTLGLNWQTLFGVVTGIGEAAFMKFLGPAGVVLSAGFTLQGWADETCLAMEVFQSLEEPYLKAYSGSNLTDVGTGASVYPENDDSISKDALLQVYKMCDLSVNGEFSGLNPEDYDLFNISLIQDGEEIQPHSKVKVTLNIPSHYDPEYVKLYRQEKDGSWTLMRTSVDAENRQLYFDTEHFSLYLLTDSHIGKIGTAPWMIDSNGVLTIGEGEFSNDDPDYQWPWKDSLDSVTRIDGTANFKISGSLKGAFSNKSDLNMVNTSIQSIDLTGWNTSSVTDISYIFSGCRNLAELNVANWDTSSVTDMSGAFLRCSSLTSLDVGGWNTGNVIDMYRMFEYCSSLESLEIGNWDTSRAVDMSKMFAYDLALKSLDINNWNTGNVTSFHKMFLFCTALRTLNISDWNTSSAADMNGMFFDCILLTQLDLKKWNTSNVTDMSSVFNCCENLKALDIDNWDTSNVADMDAMFYNCRSLEVLNIGSWNTSSVTSMSGMFRTCLALKTLDLTDWDVSAVTDMMNMFSECRALANISYSQKVSKLLTLLPEQSGWYQNNEGPYEISTLPDVPAGKTARLSRTLLIPFESAVISGINAQYPYTGESISPKPVVTIADRTLVEGEDYKLSYTGNIDPGTASVTITGIGDYIGEITKTFVILKTNTEKPTVKSVSMHRLYNPNSGEHFYTANTAEKNHLTAVGWRYEGIGWKAPQTSRVPVYRLYNRYAGDHHYTMNKNERDMLIKVGWSYEGIGWYSDGAKSVPLYRQYNPNAWAGSHNYTTSKGENDMLVRAGWRAEGIAWYGLK